MWYPLIESYRDPMRGKRVAWKRNLLRHTLPLLKKNVLETLQNQIYFGCKNVFKKVAKRFLKRLQKRNFVDTFKRFLKTFLQLFLTTILEPFWNHLKPFWNHFATVSKNLFATIWNHLATIWWWSKSRFSYISQ